MTTITPIYSTTAHATGDGRNGQVQSDDGLIDLPVLTPTELGGPGGATNPEQLFAAGYAACFHSALRLVARQADIRSEEHTAELQSLMRITYAVLCLQKNKYTNNKTQNKIAK